MSYITYQGKRVQSSHKYLINGGTPPVQGVLNFNNAAYVTLGSNPDFSGSKILKWKMWIDSSTAVQGWLFSLGSNADSFQLYTSNGTLRLGNKNRIYSGNGERQIPMINDMSGQVLDCFAVKTASEILWVQIGGYSSGDQALGSSGNPPDTVSRIGANGTVPIQNSCAGMYVWNLEADVSLGVSFGAWSGYGTTPNADPAWVDTVGSNNGTITGTGLIKTVTNPPVFNDWFLPSKDELTAMRTNLHLFGVGNFNNSAIYWTSSEYSTTDAYAIQFSSGVTNHVAKYGTFWARAARSFTAGIGAYNLRDLGPAGGRIFYIDGGTTYYEAAPSDSLFGNLATSGGIWMNLTTFGIGPPTGTIIGTGITNTPLIIAATGHIYSAAGVCHALSIKQ